MRSSIEAAIRLAKIRAIIEDVDRRCEVADGPVTRTRHEMTDAEMRRIYKLTEVRYAK